MHHRRAITAQSRVIATQHAAIAAHSIKQLADGALAELALQLLVPHEMDHAALGIHHHAIEGIFHHRARQGRYAGHSTGVISLALGP